MKTINLTLVAIVFVSCSDKQIPSQQKNDISINAAKKEEVALLTPLHSIETLRRRELPQPISYPGALHLETDVVWERSYSSTNFYFPHVSQRPNHDELLLRFDQQVILVNSQTGVTKRTFDFSDQSSISFRERIWEFEPEFSWSPDGAAVLLTASADRDTIVVMIDLESGRVGQWTIHRQDPDLSRPVEVKGTVWGPDNRYAYISSLDRRNLIWYKAGHIFDLKTHRRQDFILGTKSLESARSFDFRVGTFAWVDLVERRFNLFDLNGWQKVDTAPLELPEGYLFLGASHMLIRPGDISFLLHSQFQTNLVSYSLLNRTLTRRELPNQSLGNHQVAETLSADGLLFWDWYASPQVLTSVAGDWNLNQFVIDTSNFDYTPTGTPVSVSEDTGLYFMRKSPGDPSSPMLWNFRDGTYVLDRESYGFTRFLTPDRHFTLTEKPNDEHCFLNNQAGEVDHCLFGRNLHRYWPTSLRVGGLEVSNEAVMFGKTVDSRYGYMVVYNFMERTWFEIPYNSSRKYFLVSNDSLLVVTADNQQPHLFHLKQYKGKTSR